MESSRCWFHTPWALSAEAWSACGRTCSVSSTPLAAAAASGVELTEQVRPHADHASALSAHGVWNQHLLDSMTTFFAEHGADA